MLSTSIKLPSINEKQDLGATTLKKIYDIDDFMLEWSREASLVSFIQKLVNARPCTFGENIGLAIRCDGEELAA